MQTPAALTQKRFFLAALAASGIWGCGAPAESPNETLGMRREALICVGDLTTRVSVSSEGVQGNDFSVFPALSANDRFVAFRSRASTLVPDDANGVDDVFVFDRVAGEIRRVLASALVEPNGPSIMPAISADGRFVAFESLATNLASGDTNGVSDVFVNDRMGFVTTRVSVSSSGAQANAESVNAAISADGRFVAFESLATNLVASDTNGVRDVFVRDRATGTTTRVSVSSSGAQGNGASSSPELSADGRFVAFLSQASNLVPGDTTVGNTDAFVHDRLTGQTTRVSVSSSGGQAIGETLFVAISGDGNVVGFASSAANLVPNDTNGATDVFVHVRATGQTARVSVSSAGVQGNDFSVAPSLNSNGQVVAFFSNASTLVSGDTNGTNDVFVHDRATGETVRASVANDGAQGNSFGERPSLSADGRVVAFFSGATNLVAGDTNGVVDVFVRDLKTPPSPWAPGINYVAGDFVTFQGNTYVALQSHTSQVGWEPTNAPSLWEIPTPCGLVAWAPNTAYLVGSRVTFGGETFRAITAHTSRVGWEPPNTPALWQPAP
jgi:Tol biopolymer transport system component